MNYVVVDLEWNQAMNSKSSVFNKLPIHLRGEIIEIGAVKLDENMRPAEEFTIDVKPVYFRRMHYKVKKITGFDKDRLSHGVSFPEALERFRDWCGEDVTFLTWGCDDQGILEQNIIIHDLDWDWIAGWINLQLIYNLQTGGDKNQKSLASAMEHFEIEQTRTAHDALGDAYNTALVSTHLDMKEGLRMYPDAARILAARMPNSHCEQALQGQRWVNQGDQRYMNLFSCPEHGDLLVRVRFRREPEQNTWAVNKLVYEADESMQEYYKNKAAQSRRRGRGHSSRKNRPAGKQ